MGFDLHGFYKEVGLRLQLYRKRQEMTQEDLAAELGMPRSSYANIERGRQRAPADVIWRAAIVLGVSCEDLLPQPRRSSGGGPTGKGTSDLAVAVTETGESTQGE